MSHLRAWRPGSLAKGAMRLTAGLGLRSVIQAAVFLLVARVLGVNAYGGFAAIVALGGTLGGFSGCGTQTLMVRDTVRDKNNFALAWGATLAAIIVSVSPLFAVYIWLTAVLLPAEIPSLPIFLLGLTELALTPVSLAAVAAYRGHERTGRAARLLMAPAVFRLCGALAFLVLALALPTNMRLNLWSSFYVASALVAAAYAVWLVRRDLGIPAWPEWHTLRSRMLAAWPFALSLVATRLYTDIDKAMLAALASLDATGAYSAGYRIVDLATIPIVSLLAAAMPTMFRKGLGKNVRDVTRYSMRILPFPVLYAASAGVVLYFLADYIPLLLGQTFSDAVVTLRWLAWLPLLSVGRLLLHRQMVCSDEQKLAVLVLSGGALLNILLNLELIPRWGWRGAVVSTYVAEIAMTVFMGWLTMRVRRRQTC